MREVAIVRPLRTPVGRFLGGLAPVPASRLASRVLEVLIEQTEVDPARIEDVVLGHGYPSGEEPCLGRLVALQAGLPIEVPGYQLDRRCGSGLQAVINAAMMVQTGVADLVVAGGADSMSRVEHYTTDMRGGSRLGSVTLYDRLVRARATVSPDERFGVISGMIETAENLAERYEVTREEQDEYALRSHQRASAAVAAGKFEGEIVPISIPRRKGDPVVIERDEGPRGDTSLEKLARLQPLQENGTVTAGNASSQNDAAALCLVVAAEKLDELGLEPTLFFRGWSAAGCHPATMGIGPVPAVAKLLERAGKSWGDIELVELNEAFAAQVLSVLREWPEVDPEIVNVNGSGISLGHPIAATGARILTTLAYEMQRREARLGIETMCIGGGQGLAALFERA